MTASKQCLGNLTAIIDGNGLKAMDEPSCAKLMEPMAQKWAAFGWYVQEIDGHDMDQICQALDWAEENADAPSMIIAHTVKGKGISFIEGRPEFHNAPLTEEQLQKAIAELEANLRELEEDGR